MVVEGRGEREGWGDAVGGKKGRGTTMTVADSPPPPPPSLSKKVQENWVRELGKFTKKNIQGCHLHLAHDISGLPADLS